MLSRGSAAPLVMVSGAVEVSVLMVTLGQMQVATWEAKLRNSMTWFISVGPVKPQLRLLNSRPATMTVMNVLIMVT